MCNGGSCCPVWKARENKARHHYIPRPKPLCGALQCLAADPKLKHILLRNKGAQKQILQYQNQMREYHNQCYILKHKC